ncbi:MAG: hypothetical protein EZS28_010921 [Streblomastix strix]|uniref:Tyr recombinase domain-containing protein n=1 Tax=Streblomastix strix TaxID=222440 RepID=A0A5J4WGQ2_9EUKA|nr:MAG: hypothetical protein EZS28_010921 [Streblomastix strix]
MAMIVAFCAARMTELAQMKVSEIVQKQHSMTLQTQTSKDNQIIKHLITFRKRIGRCCTVKTLLSWTAQREKTQQYMIKFDITYPRRLLQHHSTVATNLQTSLEELASNLHTQPGVSVPCAESVAEQVNLGELSTDEEELEEEQLPLRCSHLEVFHCSCMKTIFCSHHHFANCIVSRSASFF